MKKVLFFTSVALFAFCFTSCKKNYTCECTTTYTNGTPSYTETTGAFRTTKKKAKDVCDVYEYSDSYETTTCVAK